jgi:hypothetical protein
MKFFRSKTGLTFCSFYLGLYLLSGIYAVSYMLFRRPAPEFNPPSLAALPWTFFLIPFWNSMGIGNVYDRLIGSPFLYGGLMWAALLPGALLNATILYLFGKLLDGRRRR